jgi:predicted esterase
MNRTRYVPTLVTTASLTVVFTGWCWSQSLSSPPSVAAIEAAFQKFWGAHSPAEAEAMVDPMLGTGISFDEAFQRLKTGRAYMPQKTGVVKAAYRSSKDVEYHYAVNVPPSYDPSRRYTVRFQLHGGIGGRNDNQPRGTGEIGPLAGAEQIYVIPYAWKDSAWWSNDQVENLTSILDALKRSYNIDENRVVIAGVSDGGTGAYFIAMRETTPFAGFLPLNGFIMVLAHHTIDDGRISPNNLLNKPMFVINGGKDRLYPVSEIEPFVKHLISKGVEIAYHPLPNAEHNTAWWPEMKDTFEKFVTDHARNPHPDTLTWETVDLSHNRAHWLVIDELGSVPDEARQMPDVNAVDELDPIARFTRGAVRLFWRANPTGRVDLVRTGNTIRATTKGVAAFTLLLSPDRFNFDQPIMVVANNQVVFQGRVERSPKTLLRWAARDNDRTMLYAAELQIKLPR